MWHLKELPGFLKTLSGCGVHTGLVPPNTSACTHCQRSSVVPILQQNNNLYNFHFALHNPAGDFRDFLSDTFSVWLIDIHVLTLCLHPVYVCLWMTANPLPGHSCVCHCHSFSVFIHQGAKTCLEVTPPWCLLLCFTWCFSPIRTLVDLVLLPPS